MLPNVPILNTSYAHAYDTTDRKKERVKNVRKTNRRKTKK